MTNIQDARAIIAQWQDRAPQGLVHGRCDPGEGWFQINDINGREVAVADTSGVADLIVGMAGSPALLSALDSLLSAEERRQSAMHTNMSSDLSHHANVIATEIIAANGGMYT